MSKKLTSVLIKPVSSHCQLHCDYCFYVREKPRIQSHETMRLEVLEALISKVLAEGEDDVCFVWQGGEPTLAGVEFFRSAFQLQEKYGRPRQKIGNGLQTNGLALDEKWIPLLRKYQVLVGLSIDGPQHVHDAHRRFAGGGGTFDQILSRGKMLLAAGIPTNAMAVITDDTAVCVDEIYEFHKQVGFEFLQYIPCLERVWNSHAQLAPFSLSADRYGEFLCRLFDNWWCDYQVNRKVFVRFFDDVLYRFVDLDPPQCTLLRECGTYLVIEADGTVLSCDFFTESDNVLGNILSSSPRELLNSERQRLFGLTKSTDDDAQCTQCKWLKICHGGCPKDRQRDISSQGRNHFCESFRKFFSYSEERFRHLARQVRGG